MNRRTFVKTIAAGTVALAVGVSPEPDISLMVDARQPMDNSDLNELLVEVKRQVASLPDPQPTTCPVTGEKLAPQQLCTVNGWCDVLFSDLKGGDVMRTWSNPTGWGDPYQVTRVIDRGSLLADPVGFPSDASWAT